MPVNSVLNSTIEHLRDEELLIDLIRQWGLICDPAIDFGQVNEPFRTGNGMFQQPEQLAPALIFLSHKDINSYAEIGTFTGATFAFICSYLSKFNPNMKAIAIDKDNPIHPDMMRLAMEACPVEFRFGTSADVAGREFDLCMIDADHRYTSVKEDYYNVGRLAKYCFFHDIIDEGTVKDRDDSGTVKFWNEVKTKNSYEFISHPENKKVMGIGILCHTKILKSQS